MKRINKQIEIILDAICHRGCPYVRECIVKIRSNRIVVEAKSVNMEEQQLILQELVSIMDVYDMQKN